MSFADAVRSVLTQYAGFSGRARRSEYWYYMLAYLVAYAVMAVIGNVLSTSIPGALLSLALLVPSIAVGIRRLHDTNRTGWFLLLGLVPLVNILLIVFLVGEGTPGPNQYGADPKGAQA
jgi:uncharacterized membrane protein YhaH (DUF805 family)